MRGERRYAANLQGSQLGPWLTRGYDGALPHAGASRPDRGSSAELPAIAGGASKNNTALHVRTK